MAHSQGLSNNPYAEPNLLNFSHRHLFFNVDILSILILLYYIVLYCIEGVVIAAQCTATFSRSIVLPRI